MEMPFSLSQLSLLQTNVNERCGPREPCRFSTKCCAMNASESVLRQVERALRKAALKFSSEAEAYPLTDLYLQVRQESGELRIFDDDDRELTRCVVEEWIGNTDEDFYAQVQPVLTEAILRSREVCDHLPLLKPYSFVLIDDEHEPVADLHLVDDDLILLSGELMQGLSDDLDDFFRKLGLDGK